MTEAPSMWSAGNPKLQTAWDGTSLSAIQFCPRKYQLSIIEGWVGDSVDLEFGIMVHQCMDVYGRARIAGKTKDEAQLMAVKEAMEISGHYEPSRHWNAQLGDEVVTEEWVPWGGRYEDQWRCEGTTPYKNYKGNKAKCPYSLKNKWFPGDGPSVCGSCGSATHTERRWLPVDAKKDRFGLVRLVAWYIEDQSDDPSKGGLGFYSFPDGTPAIELPFRIPLPWQTPAGETYILCGYLDKIATFGPEKFTGDYKTTKKGLNAAFYNGYNPSNQMDTYDLAGSIMYPDLKLQGVMVEGIQVLANGSKSGMGMLRKTEGQREEHLKQIGLWIKQAELYAEADYWPMAKSNCWMCEFKSICSKDPGVREMYLRGEYHKRHWNPLEER